MGHYIQMLVSVLMLLLFSYIVSFCCCLELVFIDCPSLYMASQICNTLDQTSVKLQHYILPNIDVSKTCRLPVDVFTSGILFNAQPNAIKMEIAMRQEPLLVFINGRSGGNQGLDLLTKFRHYLNPHQVFDLANGGPHIGYEYLASHIFYHHVIVSKTAFMLSGTSHNSGF